MVRWVKYVRVVVRGLATAAACSGQKGDGPSSKQLEARHHFEPLLGFNLDLSEADSFELAPKFYTTASEAEQKAKIGRYGGAPKTDLCDGAAIYFFEGKAAGVHVLGQKQTIEKYGGWEKLAGELDKELGRPDSGPNLTDKEKALGLVASRVWFFDRYRNNSARPVFGDRVGLSVTDTEVMDKLRAANEKAKESDKKPEPTKEQLEARRQYTPIPGIKLDMTAEGFKKKVPRAELRQTDKDAKNGATEKKASRSSKTFPSSFSTKIKRPPYFENSRRCQSPRQAAGKKSLIH
jgi:hypothetical protein